MENYDEQIKIFSQKFEKNDQDIEKLFEKTNYEKVRYIKFMNESIQQNTAKLEEFQTVIDKLKPLYEHFETNVTKAIESEVTPIILKNVEMKFSKLFVAYDEYDTMIKNIQGRIKTNQEKIRDNFHALDSDVGQLNTKLSQFNNDFVSNLSLKNELSHYCSMGLFQKSQREMTNFISFQDFNQKIGILEHKIDQTANKLSTQIYTKKEVQIQLQRLKDVMISVTDTLVTNDTFKKHTNIYYRQQEENEEKFKVLSEDDILTRNMVKINENKIRKLQTEKTDNTTMGSLQKELKERYCLYDDLKELYTIVNPPIERFTKLVQQFTVDNDNAQKIIFKFDETLSTKANKTDIFDLRNIITTLSKITETKELEEQMNGKLSEVQNQFKKLDKSLSQIGETMSQDIFQAVKKANDIVQLGQAKIQEKIRRQNMIDQKNLKKIGQIPPVNTEEISKMFENSIGPNDISSLHDLKANKVDLEQCMRQQDNQQRQISQILVLMIELLKTLLKQGKTDENQIQAKRLYILQQAMRVMKWVDQLQNQNLSLITSQSLLPEDLIQLNDHSKKILKEFPKPKKNYETIGPNTNSPDHFHHHQMEKFMTSTLVEKRHISLPKYRPSQLQSVRNSPDKKFDLSRKRRVSIDYDSTKPSDPISRGDITFTKRVQSIKTLLSDIGSTDSIIKREHDIKQLFSQNDDGDFTRRNSVTQQKFFTHEAQTLHGSKEIQLPHI